METAKIIKKLRKESNLTQEELANLLGLQKSAIAKYENGRVSNIKASTLKKMAEIFGCSPSVLLGYEEPIKSFPMPTKEMISDEKTMKESVEIMNIFLNVSKDNQEYLLKTARMIYKEQNEK